MTDLQWDRNFALEQAGEDEELLAELLELLQQSTANDLAKMKAAIASGNGEGVGDSAHSIKGAAASLGIEKLREVAYEAEKAGRANDLQTASDLLSSLEGIAGELASLK